MRSVNNSVETINAAATAIATAESRVQPVSVEKRRWGGCWNLTWCFGSSHKHGKKIGHAVLFPEPMVVGPSTSGIENPIPSTSIALPFIAPPSSPTSFLQSDPPSATLSPATGLLSLSSLSNTGPTSMFAIGPYAYETQLVSPPVFSTFTTEPNTAPFTPPPEPVQLTTPSSPEVPFAQLLSSSFDTARRNGGTHQKFALSHQEFQPYQLHPGISNSGTSTPFRDRRRNIPEFRIGEALSNRGWDPPVDTKGPTAQISEVASLANSETGSHTDEIVVDHRVSFELTREDVLSSAEVASDSFRITKDGENVFDEMSQRGEEEEEENYYRKHRSITLGSIKEFNFDNLEEEVSDKRKTEWWTDENVAGKDIVPPRSSWTFFPVLQPGVS